MSWFIKHLNWTYAIILFISIIVLIAPVIGSSSLGPGFVTGLVLFYLLNIAGGAWVLRRKRQSLWYVAIAFVFFLGFLLLVLILPNNKTDQGESKKISDDEYYKNRVSDVK